MLNIVTNKHGMYTIVKLLVKLFFCIFIKNKVLVIVIIICRKALTKKRSQLCSLKLIKCMK